MNPRLRPFWKPILAIVLLVLGAFAAWRWLAGPGVHAVRFADGTEAYFRPGTTVAGGPGFPATREIRVDGDLFLRVPAGSSPLIVRSRLLELTIVGAAELRVTAPSAQTGEQAEVIRGRITAKKNYPSMTQAPDELVDGDMVMVNRTIDLMEKEKGTPADVRRWSDALIRSAGPPRSAEK